MTESVKSRLAFLRSGEYKKLRHCEAIELEEYRTLPLPEARRKYFSDLAEKEKPLLFGCDLFGFNRYFVTGDDFPFHHTGNLAIDYEGALGSGLCGLFKRIEAARATADDEGREFHRVLFAILKAAEALAVRYRDAAKEAGCEKLAKALGRVPFHGARDYYEALVALKFFTYIIRLDRTSHITLGRFDKYMKPYYDESVRLGVSRDEILELTELFYISLSFDSDTYPGMQLGDNGQSLMLGGCDAEGRDIWSDLSEICLEASEELCIIDPKINVRVNSKTPIEFYERCSRLTKQGLGFPQYSNDDVVIPAFVKLGYDLADARDYTVAACWEFIIPALEGGIPNVDDVNLALCVQRATKNSLAACESFEDFKCAVKNEISAACDRMVEKNAAIKERLRVYNPLLSAFIRPCIERGRDILDGAKYRIFGAHGSGFSCAADALTAIELGVFSGKIDKKELLSALDASFVGYENLRAKLLSLPKMGSDNDVADKNGSFLIECYGESLSGRPNGIGGVWRAGTGSPHHYILLAQKTPATADGRRDGDPFASSFSPSLLAKASTPTAAVSSFTKQDLTKVMNGGPFTIELHDSVFASPEGESKVAALVKSFFDLGGHQMQINAVNRDTLLAAKANPDNYKNLVVRVWGWSGYFVELDEVFQDHIIKRTEFTV